MQTRNYSFCRDGFTLIELLVVVGVIALLAALFLPTMTKAKASAKSAACKSNLRQLGLALNMYVIDHDKYPGNAAIYAGPVSNQRRDILSRDLGHRDELVKSVH